MRARAVLLRYARLMIDSSLPLIDLHRHLDGNVRLETVIDLAATHGIELPATDASGLAPYVRVTEPTPGLMDFLAKFAVPMSVLVDLDACRRIAYENVEDALAAGIDYAELRFSPWFMAETHGLDPAAVVEAVADGVAAGSRDTGVETRLIGIISRTYGPETGLVELEALLTHRGVLTGIDLAGDETRFPAPLFAEHFRRVRDASLHVTVHAGEAAGPESVWQAIRELGAERIGHGVRAIEDPALVEYLAENGVGIESCLTSNVQTSTVPSYTAHPLRLFLEAGVLATINSDDPGISGIDLPHEYEVAAPAAGLTREQIRQAQLNSLAVCFLTQDERLSLLDRKRTTS